MIVISDTSVISGLFRIRHLHLLPAIFSQIIIPQQVYTELVRLQHFGYDTAFLKSDWLTVGSIQDTATYHQLCNDLDEGEAEAIILACELHADWLLIDEAKGRQIASQMGVPIIGILGILIQAKTQKLIPVIKPLLDQLIQVVGFRVSKTLYEIVLRDNGE